MCYYHPQILKNEIEYLHSKLSKANGGKYEREFKITGGKRFKLIVDDGHVFLKCIDPFEDIFEVSRDIVGKNIELTDLLEPSLFESHKQIVNALFEVYYDLGTEYCQKMYFNKNQIQEEAEKKVKDKYGLVSDEEKEMLIKTFKE